MPSRIEISVRSLVEFVLRSGDLGASSSFSPARMQEGIKVHQQLQQIKGRYIEKELPLRLDIKVNDIDFRISGRADGLMLDEGFYIIDEIKSTAKSLSNCEEEEVHLAQAKFYAYIYALDNKLDNIGANVTYYSLHDEDIKTFEHEYEREELETYVTHILHSYSLFCMLLERLKDERDKSILTLEFPFDSYRKGQKKMINDVYRAISQKKRLFVKAPTGIGKTISTIYPALKSLIYEDNEKIFYLTSKTINREAASDTLMLLKDAGLSVRAIALTAKDKICPYGSCDLNACDYARGHFDRINSAIYDILETQDIITRDVILSYSESHKVCPFEFALDISLFCDVIIGDYNYAFDPAVYLKRFFAEQMGKYIFLMDEAHNFIDRARDMFSASIEKTAFLDLRKLIKSAIKDHTMIPKELSDVLKSIGHVNAGFLKLKPEQAEIEFSQKALPENLVKAIRGFIENSDYYFSEYPNANEEVFYQDLLSLYFEAHAFIRIAELYDERYTMLGYQYDKNLRVKLFCIDPSALVKDALSRCTSLIAFSATLIPASYYISMMGGLEDAVYLMLDSPFNPERLKVMIDSSVSTRYSHRQRSIDRVVQRIHSAVSSKNGNYIAFFPSYEYMNQIYEEFSKAYEEIECIVQERSFTELQREDFLKQFVDQNTHVMVGFAVMGGAFSEGIDLKGDRLSGAIIATVGLPGISYELDLIMEYFNNEGKNGFDYAYRYQGMNKVMQSAGRVIRTSSDKGFILLLDDRFLEASYQNLMPREWLDFERVSSPLQIKNTLDKFWQEEK